MRSGSSSGFLNTSSASAGMRRKRAKGASGEENEFEEEGKGT
jgi:hypothetical protein